MLKPLVQEAAFQPQAIERKSFAAASLCKWVIAMVKYHQIRCEVAPKEEKLVEARERLAQSKAALNRIQDRARGVCV